ncbi:MAG: DUF2807 domain-containing protein [Bacteroidia bacterium]|nr:DUF2807 domain-containing protein [Bacteroidia bacterium]
MRKITFLLIILTAVAFSACFNFGKVIRGNGHFIDEERTPVGSFSSLVSEGDFEVVIIKDSVQKIILHGEDNITPEVATDIINGELVIHYKKENLRFDHEGVTVFVHTPVMSGIKLTGSGDINTLDEFNEGETKVELSGSGDIRYRVNCTKITAKVTGSGDITTEGTSTENQITIDGSGNADFLMQPCDKSFITITGSGNVTVDVANQMDVNISGSGSVRYRGTPSMNVKITGSGAVVKI